MNFKTPFAFMIAIVFVVILVSFAPIILGETALETNINLTSSAADQLEGVEGFAFAGISFLSIGAFIAIILFIIVALTYGVGLSR